MSDARLFIEQPLDLETLAAAAHDDERQTAQSFGTQQRQKEYLMWRFIVRRELGRDTLITYSANHKPLIVNKNINIGVAHSDRHAAVVMSSQPCADDIEPLSRDFSRAASRFMSQQERMLSDDPRLQAAVWCAKETLYKYDGNGGLDFIEDLHVTEVDFGTMQVTGYIRRQGPVVMHMVQHDGDLVVYVG